MLAEGSGKVQREIACGRRKMAGPEGGFCFTKGCHLPLRGLGFWQSPIFTRK